MKCGSVTHTAPPIIISSDDFESSGGRPLFPVLLVFSDFNETADIKGKTASSLPKVV